MFQIFATFESSYVVFLSIACISRQEVRLHTCLKVVTVRVQEVVRFLVHNLYDLFRGSEYS